MSSIWSLYNLTRSPFARHIAPVLPLELVVGRERLLEQVFAPVMEGGASLQLLEGVPGVGLTTTIHALCDVAMRAGALAPDVPVRLSGTETPDSIWLACLRATYNGIVGQAGGAVAETGTVRDVRAFLQMARLQVQDGEEHFSDAPDWLQASAVVPELLADLMHAVHDQVGRLGVVIPVEWAVDTPEDRARVAAAIGVMWGDCPPGLHLVAVDVVPPAAGTAHQAPGGMRAALEQVGLSPIVHTIAPLTLGETWDALWRRCWYLRENSARRVQLPVSGPALAALFPHFQGDLGGLLQALSWSADELVGYGSPLNAPMSEEDVRGALVGRVKRTMEALEASPMSDPLQQWLMGEKEGGFAGVFRMADIAPAGDEGQGRDEGPDGAPDGGFLDRATAARREEVRLGAMLHRALATLERGGCVRPIIQATGDPVYAWTGVTRAALTV